MWKLLWQFFWIFLSGSFLVEINASDSAPFGPVAHLSYGSFRGIEGDAVTSFLGIPFAAPPIGNLRYERPAPPPAFDGIRDAVSYGDACTQQLSAVPIDLPPNIPLHVPPLGANMSENCLFINVFRPTKVSPDKKLPVLFYIYGGSFKTGAASQYPGDIIVNRSLALGEPVVYVAANYRLGLFGFLGGRQVKDAGIANAGLHDQIFALRWVQDQIEQFGGDPDRVTVWGESAGAISIGIHLTLNNGQTNGLFHGAIMESGSPFVLPPILRQQEWFNFIADAANCTTAVPDVLECLRNAPYDALVKANNASPGNASLSAQPVVDGDLVISDPFVAVKEGKYAKVPFITGDTEDEGTLFAYLALNVMYTRDHHFDEPCFSLYSTNDDFRTYMKTIYFPFATEAQLNALLEAYPEDPSKGSPFHTGTADAITPQFKRIAAVLGDSFFQAPRRVFLESASKTQATYAFRYARGIKILGFGAVHGSDVSEFFATGDDPDFVGVDAVVYFAYNGNPNAPKESISGLKNLTWPQWSTDNPALFTFNDLPAPINITSDTYRAEEMKVAYELMWTQVGNASL